MEGKKKFISSDKYCDATLYEYSVSVASWSLHVLSLSFEVYERQFFLLTISPA